MSQQQEPTIIAPTYRFNTAFTQSRDLPMTRVMQMIEDMVNTQSQLNTNSYKSDWLVKGKTGEYDYQVAAAQELGEFLDSLPFAWWSSPTPDRQNCVTELVDAWHFIMSQAIIDNAGNVNRAIHACYNTFSEAVQEREDAPGPACISVKNQCKRTIVALYDADTYDRLFYVNQFFGLCFCYEVSLETLYYRYIAKAELNKFRQENGYSTKPRTYLKSWTVNGKTAEDNFFVSTYVDDALQSGLELSRSSIRQYVSETYETFKVRYEEASTPG